MTAQQKFEKFYEANPVVYTKLLEYAQYAKGQGIKRLGIRLLWERLRWDQKTRTFDAHSSFKLNDHYKEFYARLLLQEPGFEEFFQVRRSRADRMFS